MPHILQIKGNEAQAVGVQSILKIVLLFLRKILELIFLPQSPLTVLYNNVATDSFVHPPPLVCLFIYPNLGPIFLLRLPVL